MRELNDVEVTIIEIDSDGDGLGDEELVIVVYIDG
jgi:hypothetical protein